MGDNIFTSLIECSCGKNYRFIKERGVNKYLCSGYSRNISDCKRYIIKEDELLYLVQIFCNRNNIQIQHTNNFMISIIDKIYIDWKNDSIKITYKNGEEGVYAKHKIHI